MSIFNVKADNQIITFYNRSEDDKLLDQLELSEKAQNTDKENPHLIEDEKTLQEYGFEDGIEITVQKKFQFDVDTTQHQDRMDKLEKAQEDKITEFNVKSLERGEMAK